MNAKARPGGGKVAGLVLGLVLFLVTGCFVISVNPFYEEKEVFFEPALLGRWQGEGQHWRFEPSEHEAKAYLVTYSAEGKASKMWGHLFKLEEQWLLDLTGGTTGEVLPPPIPSHMVLRVKLEEGKLTLQALDYEWVKEWLKKNPKALRHQWRVSPDDPEAPFFVLTAETAELREFLRQRLKDAEAWSARIQLERPEER